MKQEFRGIQGFDVTTGTFIFNPETTFQVVDKLNDHSGESQWVGIEVYPVQEHKYFGCFKILPEVTDKKIRGWQQKYNHTKISRIHLEFAYDDFERRHQIKNGDFHKSRISPLWHRILYEQIRDAFSGYGVDLAYQMGLSANVHTNVALGIIEDGYLEKVKKMIPELIIENSINYNCPRIQGPILYDPKVIIEEIVEKYGLNKFLLDVDHLIDFYDKQGIDPLDVIRNSKVQKYTVAIHVAELDHKIIKPGKSPFYEELFKEIAQTTFQNPVRLVFDYSPLELLKYPMLNQKVGLFRDTIDWVLDIQKNGTHEISRRA